MSAEANQFELPLLVQVLLMAVFLAVPLGTGTSSFGYFFGAPSAALARWPARLQPYITQIGLLLAILAVIEPALTFGIPGVPAPSEAITEVIHPYA